MGYVLIVCRSLGMGLDRVVRRRSRGLWGAFAVAAVIALAACGEHDARSYRPEYAAAPAQSPHEYTFGIHPQRNPEKLHAVFGPLIDHLNARLPDVHFTFEAARNYATFDRRIAERSFEFVLPNPYETLLAIDRGYRVFAKMGNDEDLRGLIVTRRDSGIESLADLKGRAVSFPAETALAATMLPLYFMQTHGLDVRRDIEARYVGSMESSLMNVYMGNVAAGTVYPPAWRMFVAERPAIARELRIVWETESLPDNSVMARDDMPDELVDRVRATLLALHTTPEGREVLERMDTTAFEPATDTTYDPVRGFLKRYRDTFREDQ